MTKFAKFINGKPAKTLDEAKKKKKICQIAIIACAVVIVAVMVLVATLHISGLIALAMVAVLGMIYFILRNVTVRKELFKFQNLYCPACGERFALADTKYEQVSTETSSHTNDGKIYVDTFAKVKFTCKCAKCGKQHEFEYRGLRVNHKETNLAGATLREQSYNLEDEIILFFAE